MPNEVVMNRALRKRAKRLRSKSEKSLSKMKGQDLQTVSNRMSAEQYAQTLELFENPPTENAVELAVHLAGHLMSETEKVEKEQVPRFVPDHKMKEVDCCAGCAWCCHEPLQVSILDAVSVAQQIRRTDSVDQVLSTLNSYNESIAPLGNKRESLKQSFDPCPFLSPQNQCTVYEARPVICRAFHSTEVNTCESIIKTSASQRDVPMFTGLFGFRGLRLSGARKALKDLGLDDRPVVLARAVQLLLENFEETLEAWMEGEPVFDKAAVL